MFSDNIFHYLELPPGTCFRMLEEFNQKLSCTSRNHHCGHYSSFIKEFTVTDGDDQPIPDVEAALGHNPYGEWPKIVPLYSRTCPITMTYFSEFDRCLQQYLQTNNLRILGLANAKTVKNSRENHHFMALFLGRPASPDFICTNKNCTGSSCQYSMTMDVYARSIHNQHL